MTTHMAEALRVFGNGVVGVFVGMSALYLMMKLVSAIADKFATTTTQSENE